MKPCPAVGVTAAHVPEQFVIPGECSHDVDSDVPLLESLPPADMKKQLLPLTGALAGQAPPPVVAAKEVAEKSRNINARPSFHSNDAIPRFNQFLFDDIVIDSPVRQACRGKFAANSLEIDLGKATEVILKGT